MKEISRAHKSRPWGESDAFYAFTPSTTGGNHKGCIAEDTSYFIAQATADRMAAARDARIIARQIKGKVTV